MEIKRKIGNIFNNADLDLANQEIGHLKELCDAKDNVIAYQKELLNIQSESIKEFRKIRDEFEAFKEEVKNEKKTKSKK